MAERDPKTNLDFRHAVSQVPAGQQLPETGRRTVSAEVSHVPDFQTAYNKFAADTNWMSAIGSAVATRASNALAARLGSEVGKNPQGDLGPSLTEFDQAFEKTYTTQAQSSLSLQAQKLISTSNLELASMPRLDAGTIANSQKQVYQGLTKIFSLAPTSIKGNLEHQYGSLMIQQNEQLTNRMLHEQREDRRNNTELAVKFNSQNTYSLSLAGSDLDKNGDSKSALSALKAVEQAADAALAMRDMKPLERKVAIDTARQSYLSGKYIRLALEAQKANKLGDFNKALAEHPPKDISADDHAAVYNNVQTYINNQKALLSESQQVEIAQFNQHIVTHPEQITGAQLAHLKEVLTPLQYENTMLSFLKRIQQLNKDNLGTNAVMNGFGNPEIFGRGTAKQKNDAFDKLVGATMTRMQQEGTPIAVDEAEAQVAATAAGAIPNYVSVLNEKLKSTNPEDLESAGKSVSYIFKQRKGGNLEGLNEKALAMYEKYQALRRSKIPQEAALEAYEDVYNQKPEDKKIVEAAWAHQQSLIKKNSGNLNFYTLLGGISKSNLIDPLGYVEQAETILHNNFVLTKGDFETAKKMTADQIKNTYGESHINGRKETTFYPLEDAVGLPSNGIGYIQQDIVEQVSKKLESGKKAFEAGTMPYYWEIEPIRSLENIRNEKHGFETPNITAARMSSHLKKFEEGTEIKVHKHWKNGVRETYPLIVKADPWLAKTANPTKPYTAGWDIVLGTKTGFVPFNRENPSMGQYVVYQPNSEKIRASYGKEHFDSTINLLTRFNNG